MTATIEKTTEDLGAGRFGWWLTITKPNGDTREASATGTEADAKRQARALARRAGANRAIAIEVR